VLAVVVVFAMFVGREEPGSKQQTAAATHCDAAAAERLVQQALNGGILHRVDGKPDIAQVYVLAPWMQLTIDEKRSLDAMLKCTVTHGAPNERTIVVYHDGHTGKELATSTAHAFTME
jgi:hypothetical protein